MVWNNVDKLPWFWQPFYSLSFAIIAGMAIPASSPRCWGGSCSAAG